MDEGIQLSDIGIVLQTRYLSKLFQRYVDTENVLRLGLNNLIDEFISQGDGDFILGKNCIRRKKIPVLDESGNSFLPGGLPGRPISTRASKNR